MADMMFPKLLIPVLPDRLTLATMSICSSSDIGKTASPASRERDADLTTPRRVGDALAADNRDRPRGTLFDHLLGGRRIKGNPDADCGAGTRAFGLSPSSRIDRPLAAPSLSVTTLGRNLIFEEPAHRPARCRVG